MTLTIGLHVGVERIAAVAMRVDDGAVAARADAAYDGEHGELGAACDEAFAALRAALGPRTKHVAAIGLCGEPSGAIVDADGQLIASATGGGGGDMPPWMALRDRDPAAFARASTLFGAKDYIGMHLSGERGSDEASAVETGLFDGAARRWSGAAAEAQRVADKLPEVGAAVARLGFLSAERAAAYGLAGSTPVMRGTTGVVARAIGLGVCHAGRAMLATGGRAVMFLATPAWREAEGFRSMCHATPELAALMSSFECPSAALHWYGRTLCDGELLAAEMRGAELLDVLCEAASTSQPGAGGVLFLPAAGAERAALVGMTATSTKADISRAVLEGMVHALADAVMPVIALGREGGGEAPSELRISGPLARAAFLRNLLADVTELDVCATTAPDTPEYGAALLAACGLGSGDIADVDAWVGIRHKNRPNGATRHKQAEVYRAYRRLRPELARHDDALAAVDLR